MRFIGMAITEIEEIPGKQILHINVFERNGEHGIGVAIETEFIDYLKTSPDKRKIVADIMDTIQRTFNRLLGDA